MPSNVVKTPADEKKWEKAKALAAESGKGENYAYIMGIYKRINPSRFKAARFRLRAADKRVIQAFAEKEPLEGHLLGTDGRSLFKYGLGGEKVAVWRGPLVVVTSTESVKSDESILRFLIKTVGKRWVTFDYKRKGFEKSLTFTSGGDAHSGQYDGWIAATLPIGGAADFRSGLTSDPSKWPPNLAGVLQWTYYNGQHSINSVEVRPEFRRSGVATALYKELFRTQGITKKDLEVGYRTEDGQAFRSRARLASPVRVASRYVHAGITFVESKSPLDYRGARPQRIALCDSSITEPSKDTYKPAAFKDLDPCVVAFLDFSPFGGDSIYIHYMSTRSDLQRKGYARKLVNEFYRRHSKKVTEPHGVMDWGKVMHKGAEKLYREMEAKHPDIYHKWKVW